MMSKMSKHELVETNRARYLKAKRDEKREMLNFLIESTGYNRKYLIRKLRHPRRSKGLKRTGRKKKYFGEVVVVLEQLWEWSERICSKRLKPYLPELIEKAETFGHLKLNNEVRNQLLSMSIATIDRCLRPARFKKPGHGLSTTKPGALLKSQIPVRIYTPWEEEKPGFMEVDLVAHCYDSVAGQYHFTLTATDIATGWTECIAIPAKTQKAVNQAIADMQSRLPFPLLGLDSDNGSEFINDLLVRYCQTNKITFTRCRPYKKNDQAHVEQKNWSVVRHTVGYDRYTTTEELSLLNQIYLVLHHFINFFQPMMKQIGKETVNNRSKKIYDTAKSPFRRILESNLLSDEIKSSLTLEHDVLDPINIWEQKNQLTARILKIAG
ncbi:MAG: transposase family protein [Anaerolineaceae bacterium]